MDTYQQQLNQLRKRLATAGMIRPSRVVTAAGAVTVLPSDWLIVVNKTAGEATAVNLPADPEPGRHYVVKDGKGDAASNNITVTPATGNIDGAATYVMSTNYQAKGFVYDGAKWESV